MSAHFTSRDTHRHPRREQPETLERSLRREVKGQCSTLVSGVSADVTARSLAEYAVILGVITIAVVGVFVALGGGITSAMQNVVSAF